MKYESSFPWQRLLRLSYTRMGIAPQLFWKMTPSEWTLVAKAFRAELSVGSTDSTTQELFELIRRFPDSH